VIDVLKLDVEVAEWPFLRDAVLRDNGTQLSSVRQLLVELHSPRYAGLEALTAVDLAEMMFYVRRLNELGFLLYRSRTTNYCCGRFAAMMPPGVAERCCIEAFFINTRLSDPSSWLRKHSHSLYLRKH